MRFTCVPRYTSRYETHRQKYGGSRRASASKSCRNRHVFFSIILNKDAHHTQIIRSWSEMLRSQIIQSLRPQSQQKMRQRQSTKTQPPLNSDGFFSRFLKHLNFHDRKVVQDFRMVRKMPIHHQLLRWMILRCQLRHSRKVLQRRQIVRSMQILGQALLCTMIQYC